MFLEVDLVRKSPPLCILVLGTLLLFAAAPLNAKVHVVRIISNQDNMQMSFDPKSLRIERGDTVMWVNEENEEHNMVTYPDGFPEGAQGFRSPYLRQKGETWSHEFIADGTYEYHCVPHLLLGMRGLVTVTRPSRADEFHRPTRDEMKQYRNLILEYHNDDEYKFVPRSQRGDP